MKRAAKSLVDAIMRLLSFPAYVFFLAEKSLIGERKAFGAVMQAVSLVPGITGEWFRRGVLQWVTRARLKDCCIGFGVTFSDPRVRIKDGVYIGARCDIGWTEIGANCVIGSGVHILSGATQHIFEDLNTPIRDQGGSFVQVRVGENCWIGNGAIIAANVGKGCVVGAGSVVMKPIADYAIAVGNPARVIRYRDGQAALAHDRRTAGSNEEEEDSDIPSGTRRRRL